MPLPTAAQDLRAACLALTLDDLAHWHATAADNAALRANTAREAAEAYRSPRTGAKPLPVAADRQEAVAEAAAVEARFHAAAAALVSEQT